MQLLNMAQVDTRLAAAQNFLVGLKSLPNYSDLRQQQYDKLLTLIRSKTLSFDQAAVCLPKILEDLWGEEFTLGLKQAVTDQICEGDGKPERSRQQDYRALPCYLDKGWFELLAQTSAKATALEHLVRLAKKLGLTKPSEPTYATLLALVFCHNEGEFLTDNQKWSLVQEFKAQMKKWFQQSCAVTHFVETLPRDVREFPQELLRNAYPGGFVPWTPSPTWLEHVFQEARTFALRSTNLVASRGRVGVAAPSMVSNAASEVVGLMSGLLSGALVHAAQRQNPGTVDLPGFRLTQPQPVAKASPQLALEDRKPDSHAAASGLAPPEMAPPENPAKMIASLQAGLAEEKDEEPPKKSTTASRKKPAAKVLQRPAAAKAVAKKEKKGQAKGSGSKSGARMSPAETATARRSLFQKIPKAVQDRFRGGCATCRKRPWCTLSCWAKRGYFP